MKIFEGRNVCEILPEAISYLIDHGEVEETRNGPALVSSTPVMTIYERPWEKVLFSKIRDSNPFFNLMEAIPWMLGGFQDSEFLDHYVKDFGARYADDGTVHGAYGYRWKYNFGFDQVKEVIKKLKNNPGDRQAMIQMWDTHFDRANDMKCEVRDRPCNTQIYFRINKNRLDMSTTSRSHDAWFGALGANAVHFPFLQEYIAGMLELPVGKFYQYSWNYHLYKNIVDVINKRAGDNYVFLESALYDDRYSEENLRTRMLVSDPSTFNQELEMLIHAIRTLHKGETPVIMSNYRNPFLWETVWSMAMVHHIYKKDGAKAALENMYTVDAPDWKLAAREWIERRIK